MNKSYVDKVKDLVHYITKTWNPKMKWMWGEALLGYALSLLDEHFKTDDYTTFLTAYCDYYVAHPPRIDQSDTSAPALITYAMQKKTGNLEYKKLTDRVLYYISHEPRVIEDSVNHLGNSPEGKLYPKSIWVDSLMMFSVFPTRYANEQKDKDMMNIAARQPRILAKYMQDPDDHLWYHAYWVKFKTHYPRKKLYWGRGNGWVVASLPMILDYVGDHEEKAQIQKIFIDTCKALLPYQRVDGTFETIINKPGKTYRELSFTALVASGFMHGYRLGLLGDMYKEAGIKAFKACVDALIYEQDGIFMPEISGPTIPMPLFPYLGYKWVPTGRNWSYGLAALIFATIQFDQIDL